MGSQDPAVSEASKAAGVAHQCRLFYERRLKQAEGFKEPAADESSNPRLKEAMQELRHQIASLIVEDNALFRQLLNLNDSIEELKEQHRCLLDSRCSSLESLSDPDVADQSASPTSTLSSSSSSTVDARPRFFRPVYPTTPPVRRITSSSTLPFRREVSSRPLQIVTKDANGRLVLLRPCKAAGAFHLTRVDANCPYDSGFHGSESDAENNEIFV